MLLLNRNRNIITYSLQSLILPIYRDDKDLFFSDYTKMKESVLHKIEILLPISGSIPSKKKNEMKKLCFSITVSQIQNMHKGS